jgi:hypothetical protein
LPLFDSLPWRCTQLDAHYIQDGKGMGESTEPQCVRTSTCVQVSGWTALGEWSNWSGSWDTWAWSAVVVL